MNIVSSPLCSYCQIVEETIMHLFYECVKTKELWREVTSAFHSIDFPELTPKSAFFGFHPLKDSLINHIHLIFRIALYKNRESRTCSVVYIKNKIAQIKKLEENLTYLDINAMRINQYKWARL